MYITCGKFSPFILYPQTCLLGLNCANYCNICDQHCNFYSIQRENGSRQDVSQGLGIRNDAPITERDEMRNQRRIDDQGMESIPIWDEQTRGMESIASTVSALKVTFADLDNSF